MKVSQFYKNNIAYADTGVEGKICNYCNEPATYNVIKQWGGNLTVNFDVCFTHAKVVAHVLFAFGADQYGKITKLRRKLN